MNYDHFYKNNEFILSHLIFIYLNYNVQNIYSNELSQLNKTDYFSWKKQPQNFVIFLIRSSISSDIS